MAREAAIAEEPPTDLDLLNGEQVVPGWPGAHSQGESLDELQVNL